MHAEINVIDLRREQRFKKPKTADKHVYGIILPYVKMKEWSNYVEFNHGKI